MRVGLFSVICKETPSLRNLSVFSPISPRFLPAYRNALERLMSVELIVAPKFLKVFFMRF